MHCTMLCANELASACFPLLAEAEGCPAKCHDGEFACHAPPHEEAFQS